MAGTLGGIGMAEEESFKVTDRRHREDEPAPEATSRAVSAGPAASPSPTHTPPPSTGESHGPDLSNLFVMFASSALIALGEAPDPMTGKQGVDLAQAREAVDTLLLLRDKTDGNRTQEESRLLEEIVYDLQMRFVRAARDPGG
jgi:Domain of unknown function (DUF1844)